MSIHNTSQLPLPPGFGTAAQQRRAAGASASGPTVVALGGGHGLSGTLSALQHVAGRITAVVTVADDGGSSGTIRKEMAVLPPGDLRMALAALCDDDDWGRTWAAAMQHRFQATEVDPAQATLHNHALGNLLIVALWELLGDPVDGLRWAGALLRARGEVLPISRTPLTISGGVLREVQGRLVTGRVTGQVALATAASDGGRVSDVRLHPEDASPAPEAIEAIMGADMLVLGPGSLYTSVLPHLLLPEARSAIETSRARRVFVTNLRTGDQETAGMTHADQLAVLAQHAPDLRFDAIIADPATVPDQDGFRAAAAGLGAEVVFSTVASAHDRAVHDPLRLAVAFQEAMDLAPPAR